MKTPKEEKTWTLKYLPKLHRVTGKWHNAAQGRTNPTSVEIEQGQIHRRLVRTARTEAMCHEALLNKMKKEGNAWLEKDDFLWHHLLQSFATMGSSSGWDGLIGNTENYVKITYNALDALNPKARETQVREVCLKAKIRWPNKKAEHILDCHTRVKGMGGPLATKNILLNMPGRDAKIAFLKSFPGIGKKYARNIMMDAYHDDFRNSIAVDARIKKVSEAYGLKFSSYEEHEAFYLSVAAAAGLTGWELDRLLYNFQDQFLAEASEKELIRRHEIAGKLHIQYEQILWDGPYDPEGKWITAMCFPIDKLPSESDLQAAERQVLNNKKYFAKCPLCGYFGPAVGRFVDLVGKTICHGCAEEEGCVF